MNNCPPRLMAATRDGRPTAHGASSGGRFAFRIERCMRNSVGQRRISLVHAANSPAACRHCCAARREQRTRAAPCAAFRPWCLSVRSAVDRASRWSAAGAGRWPSRASPAAGCATSNLTLPTTHGGGSPNRLVNSTSAPVLNLVLLAPAPWPADIVKSKATYLHADRARQRSAILTAGLHPKR